MAENKLSGALVFYVDVGQISFNDAWERVEKFKEKINKDGAITRLKNEGYEFIFMPVWGSGSRVETLPLSFN